MKNSQISYHCLFLVLILASVVSFHWYFTIVRVETLRIEMVSCRSILKDLESVLNCPLLLIDENSLKKLNNSEDCFVEQNSMILFAADVKYKNVTMQLESLPIHLKLQYFENNTAKDYLEFLTKPKRIIPKNFPFQQHGNLSIPSNIPIFLGFLKRSVFRECVGLKIQRNLTKVRLPPIQATAALARLRDELVENGMFSFLNGGTFLGWYRECSIIPHTLDMDIGIFAEDYRPAYLEKLVKNDSDFLLSRRLGMINDSFELTVVPKSDISIYIDLFLLYKENNSDHRWAGGVDSSGEKFKFPYLPYDPWCSADLHGHLFWVTCTPRKMIEAEYGKLWYQDSPSADYIWTSQATKNGRWSRQQMKEVHKVYFYDL